MPEEFAAGREPLILRDYQIAAIDQLRSSYAQGHRAPLFQLPTGGGKTVVFAEITRSASARRKRVLITVHRRELLDQASKKLDWAGVEHGIIAAGFKPDPGQRIQVASIQTLARRDLGDCRFDLIVLDEAHHARARMWADLIDQNPAAKLLGVTATPARLDGKGLGTDSGGYFDDLISGPSIAELVEMGFLSRSRYFIPKGPKLDLAGVRKRMGDYVVAEAASRVDTKVITGNAVEKYGQLANHRPAIAFCTLVSHAEHVALEFAAAGYKAAHVHGEMPKSERDRLIAGLGNGEIEVLASCDLISEGLDVPALGAVILLRPTASLVLHMQQIGRGMRPLPGKNALVVLDHVGNIARHGPPTIDHRWTLDGVEKLDYRPKICPQCDCANSLGALECEECGYEFHQLPGLGHKRKAPEVVSGDLGELSPERLAQIRMMSYRQVISSNLSEAELAAFARFRGYKPGWVWHRIQGHEAFTGRTSLDKTS